MDVVPEIAFRLMARHRPPAARQASSSTTWSTEVGRLARAGDEAITDTAPTVAKVLAHRGLDRPCSSVPIGPLVIA